MEKQLKHKYKHTHTHVLYVYISLRLPGTVQKYAPHTKMWNTTAAAARNGNKNNNNERISTLGAHSYGGPQFT